MSIIYFSLGTNIGDLLQNLEIAEHQLHQSGLVIGKKSKIYSSEEWSESKDYPHTIKEKNIQQPRYLNQCIECTSEKSPYIVFEKIRDIEKKMGRSREAEALYKKNNRIQYAPRIIDIDILFYDDWFVREAEAITIPHPRLQLRRFVLLPLCEIAPDFIHPVFHKSIRQLLKECPDTSIVQLSHEHS